MIRFPDSLAIHEAVARLKSGGLVGLPTETVYGLAADAFNAEACARIFEVKARPTFDPLIVHLAEASWLPRVADLAALSQARRTLLQRLVARFWPGPLTLVLPKAAAVPAIVTSGLMTVAVRVPAHPVALALLRALDRPLAAPSANRFGELSPTRPQHVVLGLGEAVGLVLDGGPCAVGVESTIVDLSGPEPRLLRPGGLPRETLEEELGTALASAVAVLERPLAPGQLASHYAPSTPLRLLSGPARPDDGADSLGLLCFQGPPGHHHYGAVEVLSPSGSLAEAAARLFDCLHRLDGQRLEGIEAEPVAPLGLGLAILDRLTKAAAGSR